MIERGYNMVGVIKAELFYFIAGCHKDAFDINSLL